MFDPDKRKQQIDTLKIFNDNVTETKEGSEYMVQFEAGNRTMHIDVKLGIEFPFEKPLLSVRPSVQHPWVAEDSTTIVAAPGLINYTIHSDLGRVVQAIIREFEQKPPILLDSMNGQKMDDSTNSQIGAGTLSPQYAGASPMQNLMFPTLQTLSHEELVDMLKDENVQDKFIESLPQYADLNNVLEDMMKQIESLAVENLSKQKILEDLKSSITKRLDTVSKLKDNYDALKVKHSKLSSMYSPHAIKMVLVNSSKSADEDAEVLAQAFLDGVIDCDTFLKKYVLKRCMGHSRRACQEMLSHQLLQLDRAN